MARSIPISLCILIQLLPALAAADASQTDWSGGPVAAGPVAAWGDGFAAADSVSYLAVPGRLALSSEGRLVAAKHTLATGLDGAFGVAAADFDGDGDLDIVGAAELDRSLTLWHNDGASPPGFAAEIIDAAYSGVSGVEPADIDGDGDLDIVACTGTRYGRLSCYLNDGGSPATWTRQDIEVAWGEAWEIGTADVDGDGHLDVVGTFLSANTVVWWRNDGADPIGWTRRPVDTAFSGAHSARGADIDGDGRTDIIGCGTTSNEIAWWRNGGGDPIAWTKQVLSAVFYGARSVRAGDLDGDGDLDVAAVGFNGRVSWWANEGGSPVAWTEQLVDATMARNHQLQLADIGGDGRLDLVVASYGSNNVVWFENGGGSSPITWTKRWADSQLLKPLACGVGDVDGDGALEILGSSNSTGEFRWYEPGAFASNGTLTGAVLNLGAASPAALHWTATVPAGTSIRFQVRGGADPGALGAWSGDITMPGALGALGGPFFQYRVLLSTLDGSVSPLLDAVTLTTSVAAVPGSPSGLGMSVHPNPANPLTYIGFTLPRDGRTRVELYDLRGRRVRSLHDGSLAAGPHSIAWDGLDGRGRALATGVYRAVLRTAAGSDHRTITLVR